MTSGDVAAAMVVWFQDLGVPARIRTDGGLQFTSREMKDFFQRWGVTHAVSSPHYPQSNGHAESAVKTTKAIIKKTNPKSRSCEEYAKAMLELRNTPRADGRSPAQIVFGRSMRSLIPVHYSAYAREWGEKAKQCDEKAAHIREKARDRYDARARSLKPLQIGDNVRIQNQKTKRWDRVGIVTGMGEFRKYLVKLPSGRVWTRNRRFLRLRVIEKVEEHIRHSEEDIVTEQPAQQLATDGANLAAEPRRSSRPRKLKVRFDL
jgi:hypothetical protein